MRKLHINNITAIRRILVPRKLRSLNPYSLNQRL